VSPASLGPIRPKIATLVARLEGRLTFFNDPPQNQIQENHPWLTISS
jgi:hypothetical protein